MQVMGDYYPLGTFCDKAVFESGATAAAGATQCYIAGGLLPAVGS